MPIVGPIVGVILVLFPFVWVAISARRIHRATGEPLVAWGVFVAAVIVLLLNCVWGYFASEALAEKRKWTAATFTLVRMGVFGSLIAGGTGFLAEQTIKNRLREQSRQRENIGD